MGTLINRSLSLLVCLLYITVALSQGGAADAIKAATVLLLPLACIWFAEPLGDYTGVMRGQLMTSRSPAFLVCACGWFILVGVPLVIYLLNSGK